MEQNTNQTAEMPSLFTDGQLSSENEKSEEQNSSISSEQIIKREEVAGGALTIVTIANGCFLALGQHRLTEIKTREEIDLLVEMPDWETILNVIALVGSMSRKMHEEQYHEFHGERSAD